MFWNEAALSICTSSTGGTPSLEPATAGVSYRPDVRQYVYRGAWVIVAAGEYDMGSITPLREALHTAARQYPKVVLDASAVAFADSTFLNLLMLTNRIGTLRVVAPSAQVRRLCEITGVDSVLEMLQTIEGAVSS